MSLGLYSSDQSVFPTITSDINVTQYGWTDAEVSGVTLIMDYLKYAQNLYNQTVDLEASIKLLVDQVGTLDGMYSEILVMYNDFLLKYPKLQETLDIVNQQVLHIEGLSTSTQNNLNEVIRLHAEVEQMKVSIDASYLQIQGMLADVTAKATQVSADSATVTANLAEVNRLYTECQNLVEELRKGQIYRGTWNPNSGAWPAHLGTNSVWDVVLNAGQTEVTWNGIKWIWGDRLLYVLSSTSYQQIESGVGVLSVNGKTGFVTISADDVGVSGVVFNSNVVEATQNNTFVDYVDGGQTKTPRLSFGGKHYLPMFDSSTAVVFTSLPVDNNDGTITIPTNNGNRKFSRVTAEAVSRGSIGDVGFIANGSTFPRPLNDRFSDIVNVKDFGAVGDGSTDDTGSVQSAIDFTSQKGGKLFFPQGVYLVSGITHRSTVTLCGVGEGSVLKGSSTGVNSYVVKQSNSNVGDDPYGSGKIAIKTTSIEDLSIKANGADFGLYKAYVLFDTMKNVTISGAKKRCLAMFSVFNFTYDTVMVSDCQDVGGCIGEDLFNWGNEHHQCNASYCTRMIAYGNGLGVTYTKANPKLGAGWIIGRGIANGFASIQGENNRGVGLFVEQGSQATFDTIYLELNARDSSSDFYQVYNLSPSATFKNVQPQYNQTDVFYAGAYTSIDTYTGIRIIGPGFVRLSGKFGNVSVENPDVQVIPIFS